ncbi:MAG: NAD(+)/NADH kinase [Deltaproteobacteria bacterium]|jgi:hypothetical protein|nr:NAD(+)/NADH kinase [Deltaproteobacteria bacterium]MBW2382868.1 NAD(+)/NADH kinase [Deltaproteobacteria bacterium]MBW2697869.1 NAD(+)/NADH kinase [Deltaproteobacteria bacterium]
MDAEKTRTRPLGIVINPVSGRDARRLFARALSSSNESKRNQVERILVGAAAAGVERVILVHDSFRIAQAAVEAIGVDLEIDLRNIGASCKPHDTRNAVELMREAGCGALAVLGGDGTSRVVADTWSEAPILPLSTGTNNVFPFMLEATIAGAAAGLVAAGRVPIGEAAERAKLVRIRIEDQKDDLALIDAVHMVDDSTGNLLPFDPRCMRTLVLSRAIPSAVGMSPVGGLLEPCSAADDWGVVVDCVAPEADGRTLLAPISPGLYRSVRVTGFRRIALGEPIAVEGPGLLAFDGDRERRLEPGQRAWLSVERDGPFVIDADATLRGAAERGVYLDRSHWHDHRDDVGLDCC